MNQKKRTQNLKIFYEIFLLSFVRPASSFSQRYVQHNKKPSLRFIFIHSLSKHRMNLRISNENFSLLSLARAPFFAFRKIRMESARRSFYKLEKYSTHIQEDYIFPTVLHGIYKQIGFYYGVRLLAFGLWMASAFFFVSCNFAIELTVWQGYEVYTLKRG